MRISICKIIFTFVLLTGPAVAEQHVLVISSLAPGDHIIEPAVDGVRESLSSRSGLDLSVEYLDVDHDKDGTHLSATFAFLEQKYQGTTVDVMVVLGAEALDFALAYRQTVFDNAPIVFGEIAGMTREQALAVPAATGVLGGYEMVRTLELIRALHPSRDQVFVVYDRLERGQLLRGMLSNAQAVFGDDMTFEHSEGMTLPDIETEVARLGDRDVIFYLSFTEDPDGRRYDFQGALGRVARASGVPIYASLDGLVGFGTVGGYMFLPKELGIGLGRMVNELLNGVSISALPIQDMAPHSYAFDFRQLALHGIPMNALPSPRLIVDEPDTFYYRYRQYVFGAVAVLVALLAYVAVLLSGIAQREKARRGLEQLLHENEAMLSSDALATVLEETRLRLMRVVPAVKSVSFFSSDGRNMLAAIEGIPTSMQTPDRHLLDQTTDSSGHIFRGTKALLSLQLPKAPRILTQCEATRKFDAVDRRLLDLLMRTVSIECENQNAAQLGAALSAANDIQVAMLPDDVKATASRFELDAGAMLRAARDVGGDFFDVFEIDEDRLFIAVGDVSGKGVPAALFMAMTLALFRGLALMETDIERLVETANKRLIANNSEMMFVTALIAIYDKRTSTLSLVNAGHEYPLLISGADASQLQNGGNLVLGIDADTTYWQSELHLQPGQSLAFYTDGATDALNSKQERFGLERLKEALTQNAESSADGVIGHCIEAIEAFEGGSQPFDDFTMVVVKNVQAGA